MTWAPAGFFPGVGNKGVWTMEVPQQGPGAAPRWALADDIFLKWYINTSFTEVLDHICSKKTLSTFPEGEGANAPPPLTHARGHPWFTRFPNNINKMRIKCLSKLLALNILQRKPSKFAG